MKKAIILLFILLITAITVAAINERCDMFYEDGLFEACYGESNITITPMKFRGNMGSIVASVQPEFKAIRADTMNAFNHEWVHVKLVNGEISLRATDCPLNKNC